MAPSAEAAAGPRRARSASRHRDEPQAERGREPQRRPREKPGPRERGEAQRLPRHAGEVERRQDDAHRLAALAQGEGGGGERAGQGGQQERPARGPPRQQPRDAEAEQQVGAEKDLEEGHRGGLEGGEGQVAAVARLLEAREGDEGARGRGRGPGRSGSRTTSERRRFPRRRSVHQWACGFPAKTNEKSVRRSVQGASATASGGAPRRAATRAQGQDEGEGPERHVEAGEGIPGVGAGPAQGRGAHEVGAEVVAEREAGDAGDLGRVADHELAREPHVEGGVEGHERIEEEVAGGVEAVPPVLGEREQGHERRGRGEARPAGRARRRGARARGGGGASPRARTAARGRARAGRPRGSASKCRRTRQFREG